MILLSVIIPTRDRAPYLASTLESLTRQTYPMNLFEVLVVDNGSTDNTKEICDSYINRIKNLHYYYDEKPGLHVGRHLGMRMAKSDILVYADDDIEAFPTWLEGIAEAFQDENVVLVGGKILPKFETDPPDWILKMWKPDSNGNRILGYLSILDLGDTTKAINPYHVFGCNFSIRKKILLEAGGFHPDAMPQEMIEYRGDGETHVSRYVSVKDYKTLYNQKASVYHFVSSSRMNEDYFYRRAYNQGISQSFADYRKQYGLNETRPGGFRFLAWKVKSWLNHLPLVIFARYCLDNYRAVSHVERDYVRKQYKFAKGAVQGWVFHRIALRKNPKLRGYILKPTFIE
jgi:glucosyl-dolichyl phosphate glucuronosyltransferase